MNDMLYQVYPVGKDKMFVEVKYATGMHVDKFNLKCSRCGAEFNRGMLMIENDTVFYLCPNLECGNLEVTTLQPMEDDELYLKLGRPEGV